MASKDQIDEFALHNADPRDWRELAAAQGHTDEVEKIDESELFDNEDPASTEADEVAEDTTEKVDEVLPIGHNFLSPFQ